MASFGEVAWIAATAMLAFGRDCRPAGFVVAQMINVAPCFGSGIVDLVVRNDVRVLVATIAVQPAVAVLHDLASPWPAVVGSTDFDTGGQGFEHGPF